MRGWVIGDDGWRLRVTGRCLRDDLGLHEGAWATDHAATRLGSLLNGLQPDVASFGPAGEMTELVHGPDAMAVWCDDDATLWVVAVGDPKAFPGADDVHSLMPSGPDRWRLQGDRLADWLEDLRVLAPLLEVQARARVDEACTVGFGDSHLAIEVATGELRVGVQIGIPCTPRERARLAVAAVQPVPGWRPVDAFSTGEAVHDQLVFRLECA